MCLVYLMLMYDWKMSLGYLMLMDGWKMCLVLARLKSSLQSVLMPMDCRVG